MIVGNIRDDAELKKLCDEWDKQKATALEKASFIEKQTKDIEKFTKAFHKKFWSAVETYLLEQKRLPADYSYENYVLEINEKSGNFLLQEKGDHIRMAVAKKLIDVLPAGMLEAIMKGSIKDVEVDLRGKDE